MGSISLPGLIGCCSQQGGVPTNVSLATANVGGFDDALIVTQNLLGEIEDGSGWVGQNLTILLPAGASPLGVEYVFNGFLRADGGTSYSWFAFIVGGSWAVGAAPVVTGTGESIQDCTVTPSGMGVTLDILSDATTGDSIELTIGGTATNSTGTTAAAPLSLTLEFF